MQTSCFSKHRTKGYATRSQEYSWKKSSTKALVFNHFSYSSTFKFPLTFRDDAAIPNCFYAYRINEEQANKHINDRQRWQTHRQNGSEPRRPPSDAISAADGTAGAGTDPNPRRWAAARPCECCAEAEEEVRLQHAPPRRPHPAAALRPGRAGSGETRCPHRRLHAPTCPSAEPRPPPWLPLPPRPTSAARRGVPEGGLQPLVTGSWGWCAVFCRAGFLMLALKCLHLVTRREEIEVAQPTPVRIWSDDCNACFPSNLS